MIREIKVAKLRSKKAVLDILIARDAVEEVLSSQVTRENLIKVDKLDGELKKDAEVVTDSIDLSHWRSVLNPKGTSWWWFLEPPVHRWDYLDWLWRTLTVIFLTASLSLTVEISTRFLSGTPDS